MSKTKSRSKSRSRSFSLKPGAGIGVSKTRNTYVAIAAMKTSIGSYMIQHQCEGTDNSVILNHFQCIAVDTLA